jgi:hypothetical protein
MPARKDETVTVDPFRMAGIGHQMVLEEDIKSRSDVEGHARVAALGSVGLVDDSRAPQGTDGELSRRRNFLF